MFDPVNPKQNFPEQEDEITKFWKKNKIFEKSVNKNPKDESYIFYDGPPFITGTPHFGTLLSRIAKDVVPRFWTMMGKRVERKWGWDAHGLPIENKVEKKLNLKNRREIEDIGVKKFIDECYAYTKDTSAEWEWYVDKIGQWVDFENAYKTMDQDYMESVMWVFKSMHDKQLIYEGTRVSLYCTRCGTPISNFEIAMDNSYDIMNDPAVTPKFKLKDEDNTYILAWTTTPWTLPSNRALVVDKNAQYVKIKINTKLKPHKGIYGLVTKKDMVGIVHAERDMSYFLAGGGMNEGETEEEALIRELKEETGYQNYEVKHKLGKRRFQFSNSPGVEIIDNTEIFYHVEVTNKERKSPQYSDFEKKIGLQFEWLTREQAKDKLKPFGMDDLVDAAFEGREANIADRVIYEDNTEEYIILSKDRIDDVLDMTDGSIAEYEIVEEFKGEELVGDSYEPLYNFLESNENDYKIYHYDGMANTSEGVGVVHSAPGFGDIDTEMGKHFGLTMNFTVDDEGKYTEDVKPWSGIYIKKADPHIIQDLTSKGLMFNSERIDHRYPYCYRCETPLIHKAQKSWYVDVQRLKDDMLENNEKINWVPDHLQQGRFKKGIESAPDWGISRTRYWATPMPVWRDESGETVVIGSRDELRDKADQPITKLILVNSEVNTVLEGELDEKGWEKARFIEDSFDHRVDVIIAADMKSAQEMVTPLAKNDEGTDIDIITNNNLGSEKLNNYLDKKIKALCEEHDVQSLSDIEEEVLQNEFADNISYLKNEINNLINEHEGKSVLISTHAENIALIMNLIGGKSLRVSFRTYPDPGKWKIMYMDGKKELDLHKPFIDKFTITTDSEKKLERIFEVCDVWLDSGSMPYALLHYPFENVEKFERNFPADFVVEYVAQTRAWFYVMHVISTAMMNTNSFKNVVVTGVMAGTDGRKMSKSYGNYPDPKDTIMKYGADALRLYFMGSKIMVAEDVALNESDINDQLKTIILPLWNSYSFFTTYANQIDYKPSPALLQKRTDKSNWHKIPFEVEDKLNIWIISKLQLTIEKTRAAMEDYNLPDAVRNYPEFLSDLSKWYIRRSRNNFADGEREFFDTLYYVLVEYTKLLAPVAPFVSEAIYQNLVLNAQNNEPESIHLTDYPDDDAPFVERHADVLMQMDTVREIVTLGQSLRVENSLKVRQPLAEIEVKVNKQPGRNFEIEQWMKDLIAEELNIKKVQEDRILNDYEGWVTAEGENGMKVSLDTNLNEELIREGVLRELSRGIQSKRKKMKLDLEDTVKVKIITNSKKVHDSFDLIKEELMKSVNALSIDLSDKEVETSAMKIDKDPVDIVVHKASN